MAMRECRISDLVAPLQSYSHGDATPHRQTHQRLMASMHENFEGLWEYTEGTDRREAKKVPDALMMSYRQRLQTYHDQDLKEGVP